MDRRGRHDGEHGEAFSTVLAAELMAIQRRRDVVNGPSSGGVDELSYKANTSLPASQPSEPPPGGGEEPSPDGPGPGAQKPTELEVQRRKALEKNLVGLSFSGGGIRSGTLAIGMLQGLAQLKLLTRFDYLSTVSGGGYAGSWLAAWVKRDGDIKNVQHFLDPSRVEQSHGDRGPGSVAANRPHAVVASTAAAEASAVAAPPSDADTVRDAAAVFLQDRVMDEEPEPVFHLRAYSNYLTPRPGLFSTDTWTVFSIYLRNLLINLAIIIPAAMIVVLMTRLVVWFFAWPGAGGYFGTSWFVVSLVAALGFLIAEQAKLKASLDPTERPSEERSPRTLLVTIIWPLVAVAITSVWLFSIKHESDSAYRLPGNFDLGTAAEAGDTATPSVLGRIKQFISGLSPRARLPIIFAGLLLVVFVGSTAIRSRRGGNPTLRDLGRLALSFVVMGAVGGLLFQAILESFVWKRMYPEAPYALATFGPPLVLLALVLAGFAQITVAGRALQEHEREWRSRLGAVLLLHAMGWLALFVTTLYLPWAIGQSGQYANRLSAGALLAWLGSTISGVLFSKSSATEGRPGAHASSGRIVRWVAALAPSIFLIGLLALISSLVSVLPGAGNTGGSSFLERAVPPPMQSSRYDLRFMPRVKDVGDIPEEGKNLIIVAAVRDVLHFRIFDDNGQRVVNTDEKSLTAESPQIKEIREQLASLWPPHELTGSEKRQVITSVTSIFGHTPRGLLLWIGGLALGVAVLMWLINVNLFSLHAMYANRLTRCYLGASQAKRAWWRRVRPEHPGRPKLAWGPGTGGAPIRSRGGTRRENRFTGFDPSDDLPLHELRVDARGTGPGYTGPFPLINTALNLVAGEELAYQDRKAESFVLTPLYCGSDGTGYAELPEDDPNPELTLGRAMAISGAAADPNMGYNQSAAQTALMTIFNARLGWWLQNPDRHEDWAARSPNYGGLIYNELFGGTTKQGDYVHLSDGGHFENLGIYELVRRRCRYIVACDFAEDRNDASENLANAIRLCRRDFGVRIEIDTTSLRKDADALSPSHVAIGSIHYNDVDRLAIPGILVFIRSSMTGDEPPDLRNYAINNPTFPHHTVADQFFDETQFESYRALGQHIACGAFSPAAMEIEARDLSPRANERLFSVLRRRWFPSPANLEENAREVAQLFFRLQESIRLDPHLREFSLDLYPELVPELREPVLPVDAPERERAELHIVSQILQAMQAAWRQVRLEGYPEHPMNRGWSNVFRRCARTRAFHKHWTSLRAGFSTEFVRFCEQELRLPAQTFVAVPLAPGDEAEQGRALQRLDVEFAREWPTESPSGRRLVELRDQAQWAWFIREARSEADGLVLGIILLRPAPEQRAQMARVYERELEVYELVVWILGPHRNVGIGRSCLEGPRKEKGPLEEVWGALESKHRRGFAITVRLPDVGLLGGPDKSREDLWLNFFYHYGFRRQEDLERTLHSDLVMDRAYLP